jgi:hypothetical protein
VPVFHNILPVASVLCSNVARFKDACRLGWFASLLLKLERRINFTPQQQIDGETNFSDGVTNRLIDHGQWAITYVDDELKRFPPVSGLICSMAVNMSRANDENPLVNLCFLDHEIPILNLLPL